MGSLPRAAGLAYREAGSSNDRVALLVHGYPESSYMWHEMLPALADAGWRALAPDLPGYGDSEPGAGTGAGTWERHVEALELFVRELELGPVALVTHDWGAMIGLRWACDHPGAVKALAISDSGFFADRRWHDLANVMRTPGRWREPDSRLHARRFSRGDARFLERHERAGDRRVLEGLRRRHAPSRTPRAVPLGRLREARSL